MTTLGMGNRLPDGWTFITSARGEGSRLALVPPDPDRADLIVADGDRQKPVIDLADWDGLVEVVADEPGEEPVA